MRLTEKLLGYLNRVFSKDPDAFLAFRFHYDGPMSWRIEDQVLTTIVGGGVGSNLTIDLTLHTLQSLVGVIAGSSGYTVDYIDPERAGLSARVLLDAGTAQGDANADRVYGYTALLWAWTEAQAVELDAARTQVQSMLLQTNTSTGEGVWLDEIGGYFNVARETGELDDQYGPRIIAEVLRPRSNNVAMEMALESFTGAPTVVTDVVEYGGLFPLYDGSITYNAAHNHDPDVTVRYGLFDVAYAFDLIGGGDLTAFEGSVAKIVERLRAAGTHLRALSLSGSVLEDTYTESFSDTLAVTMTIGHDDTGPMPTEGMAMDGALSFDDAPDGLSDDTSELVITYTAIYDGTHTYGGSMPYGSGVVVTETIEGDDGGPPDDALLTEGGDWITDEDGTGLLAG